MREVTRDDFHNVVQHIEDVLVAAGVRLAYRPIRSFRKPPYNEATDCFEHAWAWRMIYQGRFFSGWHASSKSDQFPVIGWMVEEVLNRADNDQCLEFYRDNGMDDAANDDKAAGDRLRMFLGDELHVTCLDMLRSFLMRAEIDGHGTEVDQKAYKLRALDFPDNLQGG